MTDGKGNTGHRNTGNRNTGNWNTGDLNTGNWNTGNRNTGDLNTGNRNTGNNNTGDWNTGDWNTGYFNTITPTNVMVFNGHMTDREKFIEACPDWLWQPYPTTWVGETEMTDQEKIDNPTFRTCGGYLRKNDWFAEWSKAFANASAEDVQKVRDLPGFDAAVFKEITGLDLSAPPAASLAAQDGLVEALEKVRKCALVVPSIFPDRPPSVSWIVSELTKILPEMDAALTAIKEQHHD